MHTQLLPHISISVFMCVCVCVGRKRGVFFFPPSRGPVLHLQPANDERTTSPIRATQLFPSKVCKIETKPAVGTRGLASRVERCVWVCGSGVGGGGVFGY